jgi:lysophospholipase L1-like esterase
MLSIKNSIICPLVGWNTSPQNTYPYCFKLEAQPRMESVIDESQKTLLDGDSINHTLNAKTWFGINATNYSVGGSTTDDVITRLQQVVSAKPKRIISDVCGNDVLRFYPQDHILSNLEKILETYLSITPNVYQNSIPYVDISIPGSMEDLKKLLFAIYSGFLPNFNSSVTLTDLELMVRYNNDSYIIPILDMNSKIESICKKMGVVFVDIFTPLCKNYKKYRIDGIHPNPYGMYIWTRSVRAAILAKEGILIP